MGLRRGVVAASACALALTPLGMPPTALAAVTAFQGTAGSDRITGTASADRIWAHQGNDTIRPRGGADLVRAGKGNDRVFLVRDGDVDRVFCGPGFDVVVWKYRTEARDIVADNCEGQIA